MVRLLILMNDRLYGALTQTSKKTLTVEDFIGILMSLSAGDSGTIFTICDDALGGLTFLDPRKFANEFISRRKGDVFGSVDKPTTMQPINPNKGINELTGFTTGNKFVVVDAKKKKKKGKK